MISSLLFCSSSIRCFSLVIMFTLLESSSFALPQRLMASFLVPSICLLLTGYHVHSLGILFLCSPPKTHGFILSSFDLFASHWLSCSLSWNPLPLLSPKDSWLHS